MRPCRPNTFETHTASSFVHTNCTPYVRGSSMPSLSECESPRGAAFPAQRLGYTTAFSRLFSPLPFCPLPFPFHFLLRRWQPLTQPPSSPSPSPASLACAAAAAAHAMTSECVNELTTWRARRAAAHGVPASASRRGGRNFDCMDKEGKKGCKTRCRCRLLSSLPLPPPRAPARGERNETKPGPDDDARQGTLDRAVLGSGNRGRAPRRRAGGEEA